MTFAVTFPNLLRSEWIKLRSLRSTLWCYGLMAALAIGIRLFLSFSANSSGGPLTGDAARALVVQVDTSAVLPVALVAAVLGVLVSSGEYASGLIRATFVADGGRVGSMLAKAVVLATTTLVVSVAASAIGALATAPVLAHENVVVGLNEPSVFLPILGFSVYTALLALLGQGIGLLVRATAGGIATTLGLLLVVPTLLDGLGQARHAVWLQDIAALLPAAAGHRLFEYGPAQVDPGVVALSRFAGFSVAAGFVLAIGAVAIVLVRRRDA
jgi:ABC-2 type transport system permease protein